MVRSTVGSGLGTAFAVLVAAAGAVVAVLLSVGGDGEARVVDPEPVPDAALAADVRAAAVLVEATGCRIESQGMGAAVGADLVVTSAHVVAGASDVVVTADDGSQHAADVVGFDPLRDIAVLDVPSLGAMALELAAPRTGSPTLVIARGLDSNGDPAIEVLDSSVVRTINIFISDIYGDGRHERRGMELAVDIGPGDSGGGVVDGSGALVGVVFSSSRGKQDIAYAVSATELETLIADRSPDPVPNGECRR